ncbi:hypothetical protein [Methylocystis sp. Sn-Cys]|uniref:hypothetical protein n=1 Tax=Methylocystis sp. Sn-Cys TaxID=1701263 RepID=UPI001920D368|nr:hypothetical protein [Methylocystis sp. Sn-Cys]
MSLRVLPALDLQVSNFKCRPRGTAVCDFDLHIGAIGLVTRGCVLHFQSHYWVQLPAAEYIDGAGNRQFRHVLTFEDESAKRRFKEEATRAALRAMEAAHE